MYSSSDSFSQGGIDHIDISDARLCYRKKGFGSPIIFIHGFCLDHRMWVNQLDFFSSRYATIAVDLRGFGNSSPPSDKAYSYHEDIYALLENLHIDQPIILVGLSMGARVIANFALTYPQKTRALIFVDGHIDGYVFKDFNLDYIYRAGKEQGIQVANELWLAHPLFKHARKNPMALKLLTEMVMSYSGWHWVNKNPVKGLNPPAIEQLQDLSTPALIINGEWDIEDFQKIAQIINAKINHSLRMEIKGAGHMCNLEMPNAFNEIVEQFLIQRAG